MKCNPDPPQIPVRLRALYDGKLLYMPVPELVQGFPFVLLDPAELERKGISFELAATSQGAVEHGMPVEFEEMEPMDLVVVGCVAVTRAGGRTGKGGGFADLELGIFRELGTVDGRIRRSSRRFIPARSCPTKISSCSATIPRWTGSLTQDGMHRDAHGLSAAHRAWRGTSCSRTSSTASRS